MSTWLTTSTKYNDLVLYITQSVSTSLPGGGVDVLVKCFDRKIFDNLNQYNPVTGIFTAKVAGTYLLNVTVFINTGGNSGLQELIVFKNGARLVFINAKNLSASDGFMSGTTTLKLNAGDTVYPSMFNSNAYTSSTVVRGDNQFIITRLD